MLLIVTILLTKITAAQNDDAPSCHKVRGLYFLAAIFAATITEHEGNVGLTTCVIIVG